MAADSSFSSSTTSNLLLGVMDHLWFHHIILFSEPSSLKPVLSTPASKSSSNNSRISSISEEENRAFLDVHTSSSTTTIKQDNGLFDEQEFENKTESRSSSSSPSSHKKKGLKNYVMGGNGNEKFRLKRTMSCKSLCELELEEVKGFMDLGFRFSKDHLISKRMMSLIPGLQRLEDPFFKIEEKSILKPEEEEEEERCNKIRPYLSEAWLIKRPDSPLLNLRIPRISTTADMKKHIKYWAKTVASAIQQDS